MGGAICTAFAQRFSWLPPPPPPTSEGLSRLWSRWWRCTTSVCSPRACCFCNHDIIPLWAQSTLEMDLAARTQQTALGIISLCRWRNIQRRDGVKKGGVFSYHTVLSCSSHSECMATWAEERHQGWFCVLLDWQGRLFGKLVKEASPPCWKNDSYTIGCNVIT